MGFVVKASSAADAFALFCMRSVTRQSAFIPVRLSTHLRTPVLCGQVWFLPARGEGGERGEAAGGGSGGVSAASVFCQAPCGVVRWEGRGRCGLREESGSVFSVRYHWCW